MYKLSPLWLNSTQAFSVVRSSDNICIPFDPANTDCQQFLAWMKAGNVPFQADGVTPMAQSDVQGLITQLGGTTIAQAADPAASTGATS